MRLDALRVLHLSKKKVPLFAPALMEESRVFFLETCQRYVWIFNGESGSPRAACTEGAEVFYGKEAYLFLLRVATGLESEVVGETDIFGQLKVAWKKAETSQSELLMDLGFWMQKLFEDTKEIRSRFLQNLGGSSYGTLVRRLVKDQERKLPSESPELITDRTSTIFLLGAGKIAQSVGPFLMDSELWLWNRNPAHLDSLTSLLTPASSISILEEEKRGWQKATHVVVCIPLDPQRDAIRMQWWLQGEQAGQAARTVIHLGGFKDHCGAWNQLPGFFSLTDLFGLQSSLGSLRSMQVAQAMKACEERAQLRRLGGSLSIPHGWEDLACFA